MTGEELYEATRLIALQLGEEMPMFYELDVQDQIKWDVLAHEHVLAEKVLNSQSNPDRLQP